MKDVISTGFKPLDKALGGGILKDGFLLITYDTQSLGWTLGVRIFKQLIDQGYFGVVVTYSLPLNMLKRYGRMMDLSLDEHLKEEKIGIVSVFHDPLESKKTGGVEYLWPVDPSTFLPKASKVYSKLSLGKEKVTGLNITLDGLADTFGEDVAVKIVRKGMALRETLPQGVPRPLSVMLLNRDRTSQRFISWVTHYSDHVIDFETVEGLVEKVVIRKSLLPEFSPGILLFRYKKGEIELVRSPE